MVIEGKPAGWGRIQTIRISAWRGKESNTEFFLRDLQKTGFLGVDAMAAVIRADSAADRFPQEAGAIRRFAETMLPPRRVGSRAVVMSDWTFRLTAKRSQARSACPINPCARSRTGCGDRESQTAVNAGLLYARQSGCVRALAFGQPTPSR